jgi:hypothetical protein
MDLNPIFAVNVYFNDCQDNRGNANKADRL